MSEYTNPEKWTCDKCVYYYPVETSYRDERIGECRYYPTANYVYESDYWCGKFELNRTHPKAGFSKLYKNEYSREQKMFKLMMQYYVGEE